MVPKKRKKEKIENEENSFNRSHTTPVINPKSKMTNRSRSSSNRACLINVSNCRIVPKNMNPIHIKINKVKEQGKEKEEG